MHAGDQQIKAATAASQSIRVHSLFETHAAKTPSGVAVIQEDEVITYQNLNSHANELAHCLKRLGVGPGTPVGILAERSFEMIESILAVLKSGGVYIPLDPDYPEARLRLIMEDCNAQVILAQQSLQDLVTRLDIPIPIIYTSEGHICDDRPDRHIGPVAMSPSSEHLAYIIYTSGTTGTPKGVMVSHSGLYNQITALQKLYEITNRDRILQFAPFSFDMSVEEIFCALCSGASLVLRSDAWITVGSAFWKLCGKQQVSIANLPTRFWEQLLIDDYADIPSCVRQIMIGGEAVSAGAYTKWFKRTGYRPKLYNAYGPTEATVNAAIYEVTANFPSHCCIGRPVENASIYLLDDRGEAVNMGEVGEIHIGGLCVAEGYWNRQELTSKTFLADPFALHSGALMFKSGDLGRFLSDGNLEFLGRKDNQIKIRGFRVEPEEVQNCLSTYTGIHEAVVIARRDERQDLQLVAYYTLTNGDDTGAKPEDVRRYLATKLPHYMMPVACVALKALPLTVNGKLDLASLPSPATNSSSRYVAARTPEEQTVCNLFAEILGLELVSVDDDFFQLGGHSLLVARLVHRIQETLGWVVSWRALSKKLTPATIVNYGKQIACTPKSPPSEEVWVGRLSCAPIPVSCSQRRVLLIHQLAPHNTAYHYGAAVTLSGQLDIGAIEKALNVIVLRHEIFRTTFTSVNGEYIQTIKTFGNFTANDGSYLRVIDDNNRDEVDTIIQSDLTRLFRLDQLPMIRWTLIRISSGKTILVHTEHHLVHDGWSFNIFLAELISLYNYYSTSAHASNPLVLPELEFQFADYASWEDRWLASPEAHRQQSFWVTQLSNAPQQINLPHDRARNTEFPFRGASIRYSLPLPLCEALRSIGASEDATPFMVMLAAFVVFLSHYSGQSDLLIGTGIANRRHPNTQNIIGMMVNTVVLRCQISGSSTLQTLIGHVRDVVIDAWENQEFPFDKIVEALKPVRVPGMNPLFQTMFNFDDSAFLGGSMNGISMDVLDPLSTGGAKVDLSVTVIPSSASRQYLYPTLDYRAITFVWEYNLDLFDPDTASRMATSYIRVLESFADGLDKRVDKLDFLTSEERHRILVEWNKTEREYPSDKCVHELFEAQVSKSPESPAVVFEEASLSYGELNRQANRLAHYLREVGVKPDTRVAICVERGFEMVVGLLAVLKAGGAYVPLDPANPEERLRYMVEDSAPVAVLTQSSLRGLFAGIGEAVPLIELELDQRLWQHKPETDLDRAATGLTARNLAYIIYTSGSTGKPKGVMVEHASVCNYLDWAVRSYKVKDAFVSSSLAFDATVTSLYTPLWTGGTMRLVQEREEVQGLWEQFDSGDACGLVKVTPAHLDILGSQVDSDKARSAVSMFVVGGEALPASTVRLWREISPEVRLVNEYGPTETVVGCIVYEVPPQTGPAQAVPIGKPISNTRVYILDARRQPVPVGVAGELYIGGAGVARGYLNQPELTAERFLEDPFVPGGRVYRTGDLGRWLPDGNIEFLGRNDFQVKVRGYRIELGEIEARLSECEGVEQALVIAREDTPGDKRLVAYYTSGSVETPGAEQLRSYLSASLPEYMVPAAYVHLKSMPLTVNGKLDRKALPAPEADAYGQHGYEAPQGEMEETLARIWAEVLKLDRIGRHDDFFELGGHSLLAVRVVMRLQQALGVELAIGNLFDHPVLSDLAGNLESGTRAELPAIAAIDRNERIPLSFAQQRLWFLAQMGEEVSQAYHISVQWHLRGRLVGSALRKALDEIVARHEALRTTFHMVEGEAVQRIVAVEDSSFHLSEHDLREGKDARAELERMVEEESRNGFDLEAGPLIRGRLIRLGEEEHALLVTMHHIVSDEWSMGVLTRELSTLYAAFVRGQASSLPKLKLQYADYAVWQRKSIGGEILEQQAAYWKKNLEGAPALLELPSDHPRPAQQDYRGSFAAVVLDAALTKGLRELSRRHGTTLYMTLLAGWAALLARLSGQQDMVVGTPVANRGRLEIESLVGFFVNMLALRLDVAGSPTVGELLKRVKNQVLTGQQHQDIPFEQVVEIVRPVRSIAHSPVFQVMFAWQNASEKNGIELPGLEVGPLQSEAAYSVAKFDLALSLRDAGTTIVGDLEYATGLFERATVERYVGYFRRLLEGMVAGENELVDRLPMMPEEEREQVLYSWNKTEREYPSDKCVHELFEAQVSKSPESPAVVFEEASLSYGELNRQANRLAHYLREVGVKPDTRVAICVERGFEMVVGLLAVLKAGGAYVPLDPANPEERLRYMVEDSAPVAVLTQSSLRGLFAGIGEAVPLIELELDQRLWQHKPETDLDRAATGLTARNLAYIIYTSGSTGKPKGVMVEHASVCNYLDWAVRSYKVKDAFVSSSLAFDATVTSLYTPLWTGGTMRLVQEREEVQGLWEQFDSGDACGLVKVTPAHLDILGSQVDSDKARSAVSMFVVGGEALPASTVRLWREISPEVRLVNEYGPTETVVGCIVYEVPPQTGPAQAVPIGKPISNTRVYILDARRQPVPVGVAGELYIGGAGVARGYLNQPELTAERFLEDPFVPGGRVYRTGDLGRWLPDGNIEFLGRNDFQVKVRGYRIELGEIEARLSECEGVEQALVIAREDTPGDKRLVAYYTSGSVETPGAEQLRSYLSASLPEYMVPAAYVHLKSMPLTVNGKLDRKALPAPEADAYGQHGYEAPQGEMEETLARIWAEVLKLDRIGRHDNFFELGGHSLLIIRVNERLRRIGWRVDIRAAFATPTVAELALSSRENDSNLTTLDTTSKTSAQSDPIRRQFQFRI